MKEKEAPQNLTAEIGLEDFTRRKNRWKKVRVGVEFMILLATLYVVANLFFTFKTYQPFADADVSTEDRGFIALSYFGVDRIGDTSTLIGKEQLRRQLTELRDQGYVTVTQRDILDYYRNGKPLPPRALYLMFEDGRRDTAIFAQEIMEDLNFKATIMTYPEKFAHKDPKFLEPKDLREMEASSFWELGTNGYRLEYINVFDRYDNFIGEIDPLRFDMIRSYLGRRYNHYLMDYIRDKDDLPIESDRHMKERVSYDYMRLRDIYEAELGYVPQTHVLMHANTGKFGNNPRVSAVNERWIRELFPMNFNREGFVLNERGSSLYDLTRMQPQPYWPINHLLMRIKYDTNDDIVFVEGKQESRRAWELMEGALEMRDESLILTTLPEGRALARLVEGAEPRDLRLEARMEGNAFGAQQVYLRSAPDLSSAICVQLVNNQLVVEEIIGGAERVIYREKLSVILEEPIPSVEEDRRDAMVRENEAFARYASSPIAAREYLGRAEALRDESVPTVADGAEPYEGTESFHRRGNHKIVILLRDELLSVEIDGHMGPKELPVRITDRGSIFLGASWQGEAWSQRNLADDVYDAVFHQVRLLSHTGRAGSDERLIYTSEYTGWEKTKKNMEERWDALIGWFLEYL